MALAKFGEAGKHRTRRHCCASQPNSLSLAILLFKPSPDNGAVAILLVLRVRAACLSKVAGVQVTPVLERYDGGTMTWVVHQSGSAVTTSTKPGTEQTFICALTLGVLYRLAHVTDTAGASAYTIGQLESVT